MAESLKYRVGAMTHEPSLREVYALLVAAQADIELLRALLATHVHSGITTGASNSGAPTVTIAASALNLQP